MQIVIKCNHIPESCQIKVYYQIHTQIQEMLTPQKLDSSENTVSWLFYSHFLYWILHFYQVVQSKNLCGGSNCSLTQVINWSKCMHIFSMTYKKCVLFLFKSLFFLSANHSSLSLPSSHCLCLTPLLLGQSLGLQRRIMIYHQYMNVAFWSLFPMEVHLAQPQNVCFSSLHGNLSYLLNMLVCVRVGKSLSSVNSICWIKSALLFL